MSEPRKRRAAAVRTVLKAYLELHGAETRSARTELAQLQALLGDAARRLAASFERLNALAVGGTTRVRPQPACNDAPDGPEIGGEPAASVDHIEQARREAVTALQFQDIASQLVGHTVGRLDSLERLARSLARLPELPAEELGAALALARGAQRASPVGQARMAAGAVELFR